MRRAVVRSCSACVALRCALENQMNWKCLLEYSRRTTTTATATTTSTLPERTNECTNEHTSKPYWVNWAHEWGASHKWETERVSLHTGERGPAQCGVERNKSFFSWRHNKWVSGSSSAICALSELLLPASALVCVCISVCAWWILEGQAAAA